MENWSELYREDLETVKKNILSVSQLYGKSFLITGATGSIGSHFVDVLIYLNEAYQYHCQLFLCGREKEKIKQRFGEKKYISFLPYDAKKEISFQVEVDYLIHLAGNADPKKFRESPVETAEGNLLSAVYLLRYAREFVKEKMIYISTGEVYGIGEETGENGFAWKEEESGYMDSRCVRNAYPVSKRAAENLCMAYFKQWNIPIVIARLSHTFGSTFQIKDSRIHAVFIKKAVEKQDIVLHTEGKQIRSYCYVSDSVSGICSLLTKGVDGEVYNVSNMSNRVSIREFAEKIALKAGVLVRMEREKQGEEYQNKMNCAVLSTDKLEALGWRAQFGIEEAIVRTIQILEEGNVVSRIL